MRPDQNKDSLVQSLLLVLNVLASIAASLLPDWTHSNFATADQVILGISVFIGLGLIQAIALLVKIERARAVDTTMWPVHDNVSSSIHNIQTYMHQITQDAYSPNDRFVRHFLSELKRLETYLREAAEKKELRVSSDHFITTADVLGAFATDRERIYRYTWPIEKEGRLFSIPAWRHFFELSTTMLRKREIGKIHVILILSRWELLEEDNIQCLLKFYACTKNIECKAVVHQDFMVVAVDNALNSRETDFGLYGEKLLYITEEDRPPETVGIYTKNEHLIKKYREVFDVLWASRSLTRSNPMNGQGPISLEALFEKDRTYSTSYKRPMVGESG